MNVFIIGMNGGVGRLLSRQLQERGDSVHGLVRQREQQAELEKEGLSTTVRDLSIMTVNELAAAFDNMDAIVFSAGSNGGSRETTKAIDGDGLEKAMKATRMAGVDRFLSVSVLPESWRERALGDDVEYYFAIKKSADVILSRSDLDWVILRPSLLTDEPGSGTVSLGPAEHHHQIAREDVARTLAELTPEPRISRQILELNAGSTPISAAVRANVRADASRAKIPVSTTPTGISK